MAIKIKVTPAQLRAERVGLVGQVAAAKARITDLLLAGDSTADDRTEVARLTARIAEIDLALMRQAERNHGGDLLALDAATQAIVKEHAAALDALRGMLTLTITNV
jgi:hypothetical protein